MRLANISTEVVCIIVLSIMFGFSLIDKPRDLKKRYFLITTLVLILTLMSDLLSYIISKEMKNRDVICFLINSCVISGNMLPIFFVRYLKEFAYKTGRTIKALIMSIDVVQIIGVISVILNMFYGYYYTISADGVYVKRSVLLAR